jgi:hypothetical protein
MQTRLQTNRISSNSNATTTNDVPLIQVTVLYEDLEAGLRAKALIECVQSCMEIPVQFKLGLWRFDWLKERSLANIAMGATKRSELVIISTSTAQALPSEMERWLDSWVPRTELFPAALMALLSHEGDDQTHPIHDRLQRAARQKRVDFFCEFYQPQPQERPVRTWPEGRVRWELNPATRNPDLDSPADDDDAGDVNSSRLACHSI